MRICIAAISMVSLVCGLAAADIPQMISYQGKVTDTLGVAVADGDYEMAFTIWDASSGGNMEWFSGDQTIAVEGGVFNVLLGDGSTPPIQLPFDEDYWLSVTFEGINQLPRQQLASSGYAYMASGLVPGTEVSGSVSSGSVITGLNTATTGFARGLWGKTEAPGGVGVEGNATATTGYSYGVTGTTASPNGKGIYGAASATSGSTYGVRGESNSPDGIAISGHNGATSGSAYAIHGECFSPDGRAVYGWARSTVGSAIGVYGMTSSSSGYGGYFEGRGYFSDNVGIAKADPNRELDVDGDINSDGIIRVNDQAALQAANGNLEIQLGSTNTNRYTTIVSDAGEVLRVTADGKVGIGTTIPFTTLAVAGLTGTSSYSNVRVNSATGDFYYYSSSRRYKDDIRPLKTEFERILEVEPKSFIDKASGDRCIGYIAEELDDLGLNDLVCYRDGKPDGLRYDLVSLYLLEVVKKQQADIEALRAELNQRGRMH